MHTAGGNAYSAIHLAGLRSPLANNSPDYRAIAPHDTNQNLSLAPPHGHFRSNMIGGGAQYHPIHLKNSTQGHPNPHNS
jgi:hypothetical protein